MKISRRTIYSLIDLTENLIEPLREAFLDEKIQVRAANMLVKLDEKTQINILKRYENELEELNEARIKQFLEGNESKNKELEQKDEKQKIKRKENIQYFYLESDAIDRFLFDKDGKRCLSLKKGQTITQKINLEEDLKLIAPNDILKIKDRELSKTAYRKYVNAMNMISKQMTVLADLFDSQNE